MYCQVKFPVKNLVLMASLSLVLSACSWFHMYRPTIQQGNVLSQSTVAQLKVGMSEEQVRYLMGTPVLNNIFDPNRWDYVYTFKQGGNPMKSKRVTLYFSNGILQKIQTASN